MTLARIDRRTLLRGTGIALGLPLLECMVPASSQPALPSPRRMLIISNNLGVLPQPFFPATAGRGYVPSPYLSNLAEFRDDFTVFSGLSHPGVVGGHSTENCFLTAARGPTKSGFRNTISLDQFATEKLGQTTRFASLNLGVNIDKANRSLSWTRDGVLLPAEDNASALFRRMFVQGNPADTRQQIQRLEERGSILDTLLDDARRMSKSLGNTDKARLAQYLHSVREIEGQLYTAKEWELKAKPMAKQAIPHDIHDKKLFFQKFELILSMAHLALETDSTRIVTLMVDAFATPAYNLKDQENTTDGYHNLSHHGQAPDKVRQLTDTDHRQMLLLHQLLKRLGSTTEGNKRLLDQTMVLYGSNMGDSNTHDNTNLPIILAGGGFRHGQHVVFNRNDNKPLANLFVSMLQRLGISTGSFGSSTGTLSGLEVA